ncbi:MAG: exodeoxyribonuclease III [Pseudobutyrivibrio sp.]|nr:exodeoxyribonuclease III [Pseudobutyrivibrio sp.]
MRFISWNIDSINAALLGTSPRSDLSRAVLETIAKNDPDVIGIQETKLPAGGMNAKQEEVLRTYFPDYDYKFVSSVEPARKGYAGTMVLYKKELCPTYTAPAIGSPDTMDWEGRISTLEFKDFYFVTVYTPNAGDGLKRLSLRQEWDKKFTEYLQELDKKKPVIACGDFNVAHQEIDLANPDSNHMSAGFTDEERAGFTTLLAAGFTDSFRHIHGDIKDVYSWWAQRVKTSKINNSGWRIDYFIVSNRFAANVLKSEMLDSGARQDHTPLILETK